MKAIGLNKFLKIEDPQSLIDFEAEMPHPTCHDILVKVDAISVNPVDTKVRAPKEQTIEDTKVLGWDACGVIVSVGESVTLFSPGDKVFYAGDVTRQGCNSEFHLVDEHIVGKAPRSLSPSESAAMPLTALTAWEALFERMGISIDGPQADTPTPCILIIGGAGGVGSIATQIASRLAGLDVIATASRPISRAWCEKMGAKHVVNHHQDISEQLSSLGYQHVDYILCCNSTDQHFNMMTEVIKPQGKICCIVDNTQPLDMSRLKAKSASFVWEFMFTRAMFNTPDRMEQHHILNEVARLLDEGVFQTTLNSKLSPICAETLKQVHAQLESGNSIGKVVVEGW
jgi:zinc-binding alcohol dehydrogenase family protein